MNIKRKNKLFLSRVCVIDYYRSLVAINLRLDKVFIELCDIETVVGYFTFTKLSIESFSIEADVKIY